MASEKGCMYDEAVLVKNNIYAVGKPQIEKVLKKNRPLQIGSPKVQTLNDSTKQKCKHMVVAGAPRI